MKLTTKLRPLAVATTVAVSSLALSPAHAGTKLPLNATLYGDLALAYTYTGASSSGGSSSSALNDNVSLLGVKGNAAIMGSTKFIYDFNFALNLPVSGSSSNPTTHLGYIGVEGPYGTVTGGRDNGLYSEMVDGSTYQTNWFYTPGMTALQVSNALKYKSMASGGLQFGAQVFDIGKDSGGKSTNNYTLAGGYTTGPLKFGLGYTKYTKYGDGSTTPYGAVSDDNQFGEPTNMFAGQVIKSLVGASVGYTSGPFGVVAAYNSRKPYGNYYDGATTAIQNSKTMGTFMLTGSYAVSDKVTLVGNWSNTRQSSDGTYMRHRGNIVTLMASYAPSDNLFFSVELQHADKKANESSITGTLGGGGDKSNTGIALGATYSF